MVLKFYNTLTKRKEVFKPIKKGQVQMYNCGPTVYDYAHIGNFRAYVFADVLRRYLEWKGFRVKQVMNITDVGHMTFDEVADSTGEDKIEKKAKEMKKDPWEISKFFTKAFMEDIKKLNIQQASVYPKATENVPEMIKIIEKLIEKGYGYVVKGSVYYDVSKFRDYGKLSGNTIKQLKAGARVEPNPDKKNAFDFALWVKNPRHIMQWESPWGTGYPGWHIECSAMSTKYLGETLDIHTGGEDNIFPHHECEIAQSEGANGKTFVNYWMHCRHLFVNGKKMSKSLGNFFTLRDLLDKGYDPRAIRFLLLSANYRTKLNFTDQAVKQAGQTVMGLDDFISRLKSVKGGVYDNKLGNSLKRLKKEFEESMDDDLNISLALARVFDFVRTVNKAQGIGKRNSREIAETFLDFDRVFGLNLGEEEGWKSLKEAGKDIGGLIEKRESFRKGKNWAEADRIRNQLKKKGIVLEDAKEGVKWKRLNRSEGSF